jgi:ABC-type polysaccharide/polyol phosphate transport system ATPase subunit
MIAVELKNIAKCYHIYNRPTDRLKELVFTKKSFHKDFWALKDINLNFESGKTTALLGPNGSGKSTVLQIIAGVLQPTSGTVRLAGRVTAILELGAGFQMEYSGRENVLLNGMILGIPKEEMLEKLESIKEFAQIGDFFDQPIKTYSSGMIVRLAFAAAINADPEILLVDEALAVGDDRFQKRCLVKIRELQEKGKTIIFVSHDTDTVAKFCDNAVILENGSVRDYGPTNEMLPIYQQIMDNDTFAGRTFSEATV